MCEIHEAIYIPLIVCPVAPKVFMWHCWTPISWSMAPHTTPSFGFLLPPWAYTTLLLYKPPGIYHWSDIQTCKPSETCMLHHDVLPLGANTTLLLYKPPGIHNSPDIYYHQGHIPTLLLYKPPGVHTSPDIYYHQGQIPPFYYTNHQGYTNHLIYTTTRGIYHPSVIQTTTDTPPT